MKSKQIANIGATALASGLAIAYATRWLYVSVLDENPTYTLLCGTVVAIAWGTAIMGACVCTATAIWDIIRHTTK